MSKKIWDSFNKSFGNVAMKGTEVKKNADSVIDFPSLSLGDATHYWGLPLGKITQFHGPEGSGKTFFAMLMVKQAQDQYPDSTAVWFDAEFSFDRKWARKLGIDLERLIIIEENNAAKVFTMMCGRVNDAGKKIDFGIFDHITSGELNCKLVVLDSIANLIAPVEENRGFDEQEMAALARFLKKGFQRVTSMVSIAKTSMLCINQARDKIGERIPTITYPGGRAYKHTLSLVVRFQASMGKDNQLYADAEQKKKVGHKVIATIEKTRGGPDKYRAEFWLNFSKGVVQTGEEAALLGNAYGIVSRPNLQTWEFRDLSVRGKDAFFAALEARPDMIKDIVAEVKRIKDEGGERPVALSEASEIDEPASDIDYSTDEE